MVEHEEHTKQSKSAEKARPASLTHLEETRFEVDQDAVGETESLLIFRVGSTWLAVDAEAVDELCEPLPITKLPRVPEHIPGMVSLRGQPIPLLNLHRFLALPSGDETNASHARFIIVRAQSMRVGLLCHRASRVLEVPLASIKDIEVVQGDRLRTYARGECDLKEGMVTVLDLAGLLQAARVRGA